MNEQDLREALQAALLQWGRNSGEGGGSGLNARLVTDLQKMLQQLGRSWGLGGSGGSSSGKEKREREQSTAAVQRERNQRDKNTDAIEDQTSATQDSTSALDEHAEATRDSTRTTNEGNILNRQRLKELRKEITTIETTIRSRGTATQAELDQLNNLRREARELESNFNDLGVASTSVADRFRNELTSGLKSFGAQLTGGITLFAALRQTMEDALGVMRTGLDFTFIENITKGLTTGEYTELRKQNLQLILAQGKFEDWSNTIDRNVLTPVSDTGRSMVLLTGGLNQATRATAAMFDVASSFGGGDVEKSLIDLQKNFADLQKNGITPTWEEFTQLNQSMVQDQDFRLELMKLGKNQRKEAVNSISTMQKWGMQLGMTTEEALEAQKRLAKIGQMDPKERLKQAARIRAISGAMGMGDVGEEIARLMQKPTALLTDEEKQRLVELRGLIGQGINEGLGDPMREMATFAMAQKTDLLGLRDESLTLAKDRARNAERLDSFADKFANAVDKFTLGLISGDQILQAKGVVEGVLGSGLGQLATWVGTALAGWFGGKMLLKGGGALLGKAAGGIGAAAKGVGGVFSKAVGGISTATKATGNMLGSATKATGSTISNVAKATGSGLSNMGNKLGGKFIAKKAAGFAGKRLLMAPLLALGPVGLAAMAGLTAYDAYSTYKDVKGAMGKSTPESESSQSSQLVEVKRNATEMQQLYQRNVLLTEQILQQMVDVNTKLEAQNKMYQIMIGLNEEGNLTSSDIVNKLQVRNLGRNIFAASESP